MRIRKTFEEVECFLFQGEVGFMLGSPGFTYDVASYFLVKNPKNNLSYVTLLDPTTEFLKTQPYLLIYIDSGG